SRQTFTARPLSGLSARPHTTPAPPGVEFRAGTEVPAPRLLGWFPRSLENEERNVVVGAVEDDLQCFLKLSRIWVAGRERVAPILQHVDGVILQRADGDEAQTIGALLTEGRGAVVQVAH